jgi:DNA helicase-2/ATP-dependent DNA helicase PcrA
VLFRSSSHSAQLEIELARRDIPFVKYGGLRFLEASHVKDVLSVVRWADNPATAWPASARRASFPASARRRRTSFWICSMDRRRHCRARSVQGCAVGERETGSVPRALRNASRCDCRLAGGARLRHALVRSRICSSVRRCAVRQRDLVQLREIAATYPTRERFLTDLSLDPPDATSAEAGVPGRTTTT